MAARFESLCNRNFHDSNRVAVWFGFRSGEIDRRRLDDIDARFGFVRLFTADSETEDRYRGEGAGPRHGPGPRHRAALRCGCCVRSCQVRRGEILGGGIRRQTLSRDVQRLHPCRPQRRSCRGQGQGHFDGVANDQAKAAPFISRGDRSGTNIAEIDLWKKAGIDIVNDKGPWYKEIGQGMGAALNMASASNAYVLSDRGTWLAFQNRGDLVIAVEGDKRLFNQYGVVWSNARECIRERPGNGHRRICE